MKFSCKVDKSSNRTGTEKERGIEEAEEYRKGARRAQARSFFLSIPLPETYQHTPARTHVRARVQFLFFRSIRKPFLYFFQFSLHSESTSQGERVRLAPERELPAHTPTSTNRSVRSSDLSRRFFGFSPSSALAPYLIRFLFFAFLAIIPPPKG